MSCLTFSFIIISLVYTAEAGEMSSIKMMVPQHIFMNDDITGQCVSRVRHPHFIIHRNAINNGCDFKYERKPRVLGEGTNKIYCTDFVIKNVTKRCPYTCILGQVRKTKWINVTDAMILPKTTNRTTFEGMPVKLNCTVKSNEHSKYKLIWMKGDAFVTGSGYSFESKNVNSSTNTQDHYLTIHKASPGAYTCMLISTRGKVIDTKTQYVVIEGNSTVSLSLKDLEQFFKWN